MPEFFAKFGTWFFFGLMGGSMFFLFSIESVFNGGFWFAISHLWVPLLIVIFGYTWWYRIRLYQISRNKISVWATAIIFYPVAVILSWPYVMALNAVTGSNKEVTYRGPIQKKWMSQGRSTGYHIVVLDESSKELITLNCSNKVYDTLSEGQIFSKNFKVGGFGIPYRWRFSWLTKRS
jgi:hypothetical protein